MIREGLLWYDNDPRRDLQEKVMRAARRYQQKFGVAPDICYVHPSMMTQPGASERLAGVQIAGLRSVLPNHYWLGKEDGLAALAATKTAGLRSGRGG